MEFLSEDPTYLVGGLGAVAAVFLVLLKVTQQGKYLLRAVVTAALALLALGVERVWVTDNERIEATVYALAKAVEASDAPAALGQMTDDVQYATRGSTLPSLATRTLIRSYLQNAKFDFLRIAQLKTHAGGQTRRGTAEFRVISGGSYQANNSLNFGSVNSSWSLGFKEASPGVWKVNRITPVSVPGAQGVLPVGDVSDPPAPVVVAPPGRWPNGSRLSSSGSPYRLSRGRMPGGKSAP